MGITKTALRFAAPLPKLEAFDRYLFIGPHPDDIEIGAGAFAARLASMGKKLCFLVCTDGRFGGGAVPELSPEELVSVREKEAKASAGILGVDDLRFLRLCDGGFYDTDELERGIAAAVGDFKPDVIFAPDPCVETECHKDHVNVGRAAKHIACFAPYGGIMRRLGAEAADVKAIAMYFTAKPNRFVSTSGFFNVQLDAILGAHLSQFPSGSDAARSLKLYLSLRAFDFGLRSFSKSGEAYRVLDALHMHCMPESSR